MRNGQLLFSAIQFFIIAALFGTGAAFFGLHALPEIRHTVANWILSPGCSFLLLGFLITGITLLLGISFCVMQRGSFIRIAMKKGSFSIHEALVRKAIHQFWREEYPEEKEPTDVYCSHQKIEIITEDGEQDLEAVEEKLGQFLSKHLGYEKEYFISLIKK